MSRVDVERILKLMKTQGVTNAERLALTPEERDTLQDIATENGCVIGYVRTHDRWVFVQVMSPREVQAMHNMWKRGPRNRPHPRSRPRRRTIYKRRW